MSTFFSNVLFTYNNPKVNLGEWCQPLRRWFDAGRVQLEKGEEGTPHF